MIGKTVAKRPQFDLDVTNDSDRSFNAYSITVNGATKTTNEFGQSNKAYSFDGVNDYIVIGNATTYDTFIDLLNAGGVSLFMIINNDKGVSQNDIIFSALANPVDFTKGCQISESSGSYMYIGSGSTMDSVYTTTSEILTTWKSKNFQSEYATTKYNGAIYENGSAMSLTKSDTNQLASKSVDTDRALWFGWRQNTPANRSFKGKLGTLRIYNENLTAGQNKIINNEKGRITV